MARDQQRQQLVTDLAVAHEPGLVRLWPHEHREDVVAVGATRVVAPGADLFEENRVDRRDQRHQPRVRAAPTELPLEDRQHRNRVLDEVEQIVDPVAQELIPALIDDAEDRADDHLERHHPHPLLKREGGLQRPGGNLAGGQFADQALVAAHGPAVEGGRDQLPMPLVLLTIQQKQRAVAQHRAEDPVR